MTTLRWIQRGLLGIGLLALGAWGLAAIETAWFTLIQARSFDRSLSSSLPRSSTPGGGARSSAASTGLLGRIEIPRVEVSALIAEGADPRTLRRAVGHVPGTAFPGEPGNVALAGHRDGVFRGLREIRPADSIWISTPDGRFRYRVKSMRIVPPERTDVLRPTDGPTLTLITCFPFDVLGPAPLRLVVHGDLEADSGTWEARGGRGPLVNRSRPRSAGSGSPRRSPAPPSPVPPAG